MLINDAEWADGTQSDILYTPKEALPEHAPIIVEVQHTVNFAFINRAIRYILHTGLPKIQDAACVGYLLHQ